MSSAVLDRVRLFYSQDSQGSDSSSQQPRTEVDTSPRRSSPRLQRPISNSPTPASTAVSTKKRKDHPHSTEKDQPPAKKAKQTKAKEVPQEKEKNNNNVPEPDEEDLEDEDLAHEDDQELLEKSEHEDDSFVMPDSTDHDYGEFNDYHTAGISSEEETGASKRSLRSRLPRETTLHRITLVTLEQSFNAIESSSSIDERREATKGYLNKLRGHVECLSKLGISMKVLASKSREGALKGFIFNNEMYSICTDVPVQIELQSKTKSKNDDDSVAEAPKKPQAVEEASISENEPEPSNESMRLLRKSLSKCRLVQKFAKGYIEDDNISWSASMVTSKEIMDFVRNDKLEFEIQTEGEDVANHMNRLFDGLDDIYSSQVDLQIVFKLKIYCIGGVVDRLSDEFYKKITSEHEQNKTKISLKKLKQEVNQRLSNLLNGCAWQSLASAVSMDVLAEEDKKKDFFRQWKHRIMKFYHICKLQKLLLFTNLSFTFIAKKFPSIEKAKTLITEISNNMAMEHSIRDVTNCFGSFDIGSPKSTKSPSQYRFPSLIDFESEKENMHSSFDYCPSTTPYLRDKELAADEEIDNYDVEKFLNTGEDSDSEDMFSASVSVAAKGSQTREPSEASNKFIANWKNSMHKMSDLDVTAWAKYDEEEQLCILKAIESTVTQQVDGKSRYQEDYLSAIQSSIETGQVKPTVFTHHLISNAQIMKSEHVFKAVGPAVSWLTSPVYYGPHHYLTSDADTRFKVTHDFDAISLYFESLAFLKDSIEMVYSPDLRASMPSCKIKVGQKALHLTPNVLFGMIDGKLPIYVCFPHCPPGRLRECVDWFYENCVYAGVLNSSQSRTTPIALPYQSVVSVAPAGYACRVIRDTLLKIQEKSDSYLEAEPQFESVFVVQYYGHKELITSPEDINRMHQGLSNFFDLDMMSHHRPREKAMLYVDIASEVSCLDDDNVTMCWSRNLLQQLKSVERSPLRNLMIRNQTKFLYQRSVSTEDDYKNATFVEYPNLGMGVFASGTLEWNKRHVLVSKIKAYQKSSQDFRYSVPFSKVMHAALTFPFQKVQGVFASNNNIMARRFVKRLEDEVPLVNSRKHLCDADKMFKLMPQKAYGPRLEVTLQNPTLEDMLLAYNELDHFCASTVQFFNVSKAMHQCGQIPLETLRFCPLQTVLTSTFCMFPKVMTESLGELFYLLLDRAIQRCKLDGLDFNSHLIRLAFLLQDQLTFIWTGSLPSLMHPSLFSRYKQRESLLTFGHFFVDKQLLKLSYNFDKVELHIPTISQFGLIEEDHVDELDVLTLPRKIIYALFPDGQDQEQLEAIMEQIRLCLHSSTGIVSPAETSVGWVLASNLVNSLFSTLFTAAAITTPTDQSTLASALKLDETAVVNFFEQQSNAYEVSFVDKRVTVYDFVNYCFDENNKRPFQLADTTLPFVKKWKTTITNLIGQLNEALRMRQDASIRHRQHIHTFTSDVITVSSIKSKMVLLLEGLNMNILPVITKTTFWAPKINNRFTVKFCFVQRQFKSDSAVITVTKSGVPVRIDAKARSGLDLETKLRILDAILARDFPKAPAELRAHCVFNLTKKDPNIFMPYKNIRRSLVLATGLFTSSGKRAPIEPISDALWLIKYKELFNQK